MATDLQSARDDLAYMRSLVSGGSAMQATIGEAFTWAGALYGVQCLLHWLQTLRLMPGEGLGAMAIAFVPTAVFCVILGIIIWKDRKKPPTSAAAPWSAASWPAFTRRRVSPSSARGDVDRGTTAGASAAHPVGAAAASTRLGASCCAAAGAADPATAAMKSAMRPVMESRWYWTPRA